jgi:predicted dehydrogenase
MRFAILGSGFGLYGYLPALIACGHSVVLPERYRQKFAGRPELQRFAQSIQWAGTEDEALQSATGAVIAQRPGDQERWIERCVEMPGLRHLLLEKPLARTPALAQKSLDALIRSEKTFRLGYMFGTTEWGQKLRNSMAPGNLSIKWQFCAHHYKNNLATWKRDTDSGGGVIRFFGIHLIALLASLRYKSFATSLTTGASASDLDTWRAVSTDSGMPECEVVIETRSETTAFEVAHPSAGLHIKLAGPFDSNMATNDGLDPRTRNLAHLCRSLSEPSGPYIDWYRKTIDLWQQAEATTVS